MGKRFHLLGGVYWNFENTVSMQNRSPSRATSLVSQYTLPHGARDIWTNKRGHYSR
ncbi:MAG: hypothetical protein JWM21_4239 [Acidobacteria bacterium]|nr:hypothetical protein [Acidobacteriota bacterium]